uniref:CDAN1-interacting nuclease 1 n=1 Tax=Schizaphis graminum TaxID=13262 RepID=A0A2S2PRS4_SCHGA
MKYINLLLLMAIMDHVWNLSKGKIYSVIFTIVILPYKLSYSCNGKRFEQILKQNMTCLTKSQTNRPGRNYTTEKECRIRGLDMTPDVVLSEPIAISLSDADDMKNSQEYIATNYVGGNENEIRVLNWIESKAMFGGPDQLRKATQSQLFPYWNRYGPGAVIYWFGHILEDNEKYHGVHAGVSINKYTDGTSTSVTSPSKIESAELSAFNFWSKYCLLMDGFPATNKIFMHNRQNGLKKKNSTTVTMTV